MIDSQSVKTAADSEERGFDGGKKIKERKRHIVTDIEGSILAVRVYAANIHDTKGGCAVFARAFWKYTSLLGVCGDEGYKGTFFGSVKSLKLTCDISERIKPKFEILPKRWRVERTFVWMGNYRGLSKDYEITTASAETNIMIAHTHTLLRRCFPPRAKKL